MLWLFTTALALPIDDVDAHEAASRAFLDGPQGCVEWVGKASWNWDAGRLGGNKGDAVFAGRTIDGVWGELFLKPLGEVARTKRRGSTILQYAQEARFTPLFGTLHGGELELRDDGSRKVTKESTEDRPAAVNTLQKTLERVGGSTFTSDLQAAADGKGQSLVTQLPVGRGSSVAVMTATFADQASVPHKLDVAFPDAFRTPGLPWRVTEAKVQMRSETIRGQAYPKAEAFKFKASFFGFSFTGAQTIQYLNHHPCDDGDQITVDATAAQTAATTTPTQEPTIEAPSTATSEAVVDN